MHYQSNSSEARGTRHGPRAARLPVIARFEVPPVNKPMRWPASWAVLCLMLTSMPALADQADDQFDVAAGHYARARWELAWKEFDLFLKQYGSHPRADDARFFRGESAMQLRRYRDARDDYRQYLSDGGTRHVTLARFRIGEAGYLLADGPQAIQDLQQFLDKHPGDPLAMRALPYLAELQLNAGDVEAAERSFRRALEQYPRGPLEDECRLGLARCLQRRQQLEEAALYFKAIAAKRGSPLAPRAQYSLAAGEYAAGRIETAMAEYQRLLDQYPDSPWAARAMIGQARCLHHQNRHKQAEALLRPLIADPAVAVEAGLWLGLTYKARGEWDKAYQALTTAAQTAGQGDQRLLLAAVLFHAADSARLMNELTTARRLYDRVVQGWPDSTLAIDGQLGQLLTALAAEDHAEVDRLAQKLAGNAAAQRQRVYADRAWARSLLTRKKYQEAVTVLLPLLNRQPAAAVDAVARGQAAEDGGTSNEELVRSVQLASAATQTAAANLAHVQHTGGAADLERLQRAEDEYLLAVAYQGLKRHHEALIILERLLPHAQGILAADAHLTRAAALLALDRDLDALDDLRYYRAHHPQGEQRANCLEELAVVLAKAGRQAESQEVYRELATTAQGEMLTTATVRLAQTLHVTGEQDWSAELYRAALQMPASDELRQRTLTGLARLHTARDEADRAAEVWAMLLDQYPTGKVAGEAALARARHLADAGQAAAALELYQKVFDGRYAADGEQVALALWAAGQLAETQRQTEQAVAWYERLDRQHRDVPYHDAVLYQWAWAARDLNRPQESLRLFQRIVEEHPGSRYWHDAGFRLAEGQFEAGQVDDSQKLVAKLLAADPPATIAPHLNYLAGRQAIARADWSAAADAMQQVAGSAGDSLGPLAAYWAAEANFQLERFEQAAEAFAPLPKLLHETRPDLAARAGMRQAQSLMALKQWRQALAAADDTIAAYPQFELLYELDFVRGRCLAARALLDEAREAYRAVLRSPQGGKTETAAKAQWMIGETFFHQQNYEAAVREYLRVEILFAYPQWQAAALLQAGKCYERLGQYAEAASLFSRVVSEFPDSPYKDEAQQRLPVAEAKSKNKKS